MTDNKSTSTPTALYPQQRAIVEAFAAKTNRSFSNAMQFIIEDWQRLVDPEGALLKQSTQQANKRGRARKIEEITGVTRGLAS